MRIVTDGRGVNGTGNRPSPHCNRAAGGGCRGIGNSRRTANDLDIGIVRRFRIGDRRIQLIDVDRIRAGRTSREVIDAVVRHVDVAVDVHRATEMHAGTAQQEEVPVDGAADAGLGRGTCLTCAGAVRSAVVIQLKRPYVTFAESERGDRGPAPGQSRTRDGSATENRPVIAAATARRAKRQRTIAVRRLGIRIGRHRTAAHAGHDRHRRRHRRPHRGIRLRFRAHPRRFGCRRPCTRRRVPDGAITLVHVDCLCRKKGRRTLLVHRCQCIDRLSFR